MSAFFLIWLMGSHWSGTLASTEEGFIENTGIFEPGSRLQVAITPDREFFLLNSDDSLVQHYGSDGRLIRTIGQRGKAPGQFENPGRLQLCGDRLMVYENDSVTAFTLDGELLFKRRLPKPFGITYKGMQGWYFQSMYGLEETFSVLWFSEDFQKQDLLMELHSELDSGVAKLRKIQTERKMPNIKAYPVNPAKGHPFLRISGDGHYVYLSEEGRLAIHVWDTATRELAFSYQPKYEPIPLDMEWAELAYQKYLQIFEMENVTGSTLQHYRDFPRYFPPVKFIVVGYDNILMIVLYTAVGGQYELRFFDQNFKPISVPLSQDAFVRTLAIVDGWGYVLTYDDEELGIARVPRAQINQFVLDHPRDPEWTKGL